MVFGFNISYTFPKVWFSGLFSEFIFSIVFYPSTKTLGKALGMFYLPLQTSAAFHLKISTRRNILKPVLLPNPHPNNWDKNVCEKISSFHFSDVTFTNLVVIFLS